ncbi:MAG: molecular chaperone DnaK, partial [Anaerolineaceae bacterium]
ADKKTETEKAVAQVREVMNDSDVESIRKATDKLGQVVQQLGASMYQQPGSDGGAQQTGGPTPQKEPGAEGGDDVVDGEFRNA